MNEQLKYGYDAAGNLAYRTNNALIENFQVNNLNELTANTNGGTLTVMGTTSSRASSVTVNSTSAALYSDATFAADGLSLTTEYTAIASDSLGRSATNSVTVSIATNTTFQYDGNGNLTNDGLRSFAYDDENQLIQVWVVNQWFSQFTYDGKMRRRIRQEYTWQGGAWVQTNEVYYVYDGNNVIQERDINNLPTTTYTRGKDLSGSLESAGGIGGLLARTSQAYADAPLAGQSYYHADGNGNVTMLINSSNAVVAKYLYDAFGNTLSMSGPLAPANLIRFSSKEYDPNPGIYYYLYRYYDPILQRWPNRDPIEEQGGINLYRMTFNDAVNLIDSDGLAVVGKNGAGNTVVSVSPCEIVVYIGHGNPINEPIFTPPPKGPSPCAIGFIGCYAGQINLKTQNTLGKCGVTMLPGSPTGEKPGDDIWNGPVNPIKNSTWWNPAMQNMQNGVTQLVNQWLASGACTTVTVTTIGLNGSTVQTYTKPIPANPGWTVPPGK